MKYVKLVAKPDTWYKAGSECYCDFTDWGERLTLKEWNHINYLGTALDMVGIRVCTDNPNEHNLGYKAGDERMDGEWCQVDEFDVEIVDEKYSSDRIPS